jgi:hypothetical protein
VFSALSTSTSERREQSGELRVTGPKLWGPTGLQANTTAVVSQQVSSDLGAPPGANLSNTHVNIRQVLPKLSLYEKQTVDPNVKSAEQLERERLARTLFSGEEAAPLRPPSASLVPSVVSDLLDIDNHTKITKPPIKSDSVRDLLDI